MAQALEALIVGITNDDDGKLEALGIKIGKLYTDMGYPIDMALARLTLSVERKLVVIDGACQWLIQHKRNSGATDKSIERQRNTNRKMLEDFMRSGETGAY